MTSGTNVAAAACYAACGFRMVGVEQEVGRKFNRWLDVVLEAGARDVVFVPVAVNYDRVLEDRTLLRKLDPHPAPARASRPEPARAGDGAKGRGSAE